MIAEQGFQQRVAAKGYRTWLQHRGMQNREYYRAVSNGCRTSVFSKELQLKVTGHGCSAGLQHRLQHKGIQNTGHHRDV